MKIYQLFSVYIIIITSFILVVMSISIYAQTDSSSDEYNSSINQNEQNEKREPIIPKYEEREMPQVGITFWNLLRWVFSLSIVIVLIYVVMYLLKKGWSQKQRPSGTQGSFNIIGHMSIGSKRMLYLVEVADRVLILGVTEAGINTLSEITEQETVMKLKNEALMYETNSRFVEYLKKAASKAKPTS